MGSKLNNIKETLMVYCYNIIDSIAGSELNYIKETLKNGADVDVMLRDACIKGRLEVVRYLLTSPYLKEHYRREYRHANIYAYHNNDYALIEACRGGHLDIVKYLLTSPELKDHANALDDGLLKACYYGHLDVVKYLLTSSELKDHADIHAKRWEGTPLGMACYGDNFEIVKYLLTSPELTEHADIHAGDDDVLYKALFYSNNVDIAQFLLTSPELTEHADIHAVKEIALHDIYDNVVCNKHDDDDIQRMLEKVAFLASHGADLEKIQPLEKWFTEYGNEFMFKAIECMRPEALQPFMQEYGEYISSQYILVGIELPDNIKQCLPDIEHHQEQELYL